jgi:hypothetical protein
MIWAEQQHDDGGVEMAGFSTLARMKKDNARAAARPIEKADARHKSDLFRKNEEDVFKAGTDISYPRSGGESGAGTVEEIMGW